MTERIRALPPPQPLLPATQNQAPPQSPLPEQFMYKNRLQQYTSRLSLPLPVYSTVNEGTAHAPMFRCSVLVDNTNYTTESVYTNIKSAEQNVAKIAFDNIMQKVKDEGSPLIREHPIFCKAILNEYADKKGFSKPTYEPTQQQEGLPSFVSSLVFNGHLFTGPAARNKKEAEQLAARVAILSILGTPGLDSAIMSNIVKTKYQPYIGLNNVNGSNNKDIVAAPMVTDGELISDPAPNQGSEIVNTGVMSNVEEVIENRLEHVAMVPAPNQPIHEFKKQKVEPSTASTALMAPPITFVPPVQEPPPGAGPSSAKKRRKKGKNHLPGAQPVATSGADLAYLANLEVSGATSNLPSSTVDLPSTAVIRNTLNQSASIHIANQPLQKLKEATKDTPNLVPIPPPVAFVPPSEEQHSGACPGLSAKRRKKRKKNQQPGAQFPYPAQVPGLVRQ